MFATKLCLSKSPVLKSFDALAQINGHGSKESPPITRPTIQVLDEGKPSTPPPAAHWISLANGQWLRLVMDQRLNHGRRIYRIELFDQVQSKRLAIFRRATEATR